MVGCKGNTQERESDVSECVSANGPYLLQTLPNFLTLSERRPQQCSSEAGWGRREPNTPGTQ